MASPLNEHIKKFDGRRYIGPGSVPTSPNVFAALRGAGASTEVRVTSNTGGQKGSKQGQLGWAPPDAMLELARVYGAGAEKYSPTNFRQGYEWSLSYNAMQRHLLAWLGGESLDPETDCHHLAHAAWHCLTLMHYEKQYPELDDVRWTEDNRLRDQRKGGGEKEQVSSDRKGSVNATVPHGGAVCGSVVHYNDRGEAKTT